MKLVKARITNYRSVRDSGWFEIEPEKTILVGPNEAGKTAIFRALQTINPPDGEGELKALRDYPRSDYNKIQRKVLSPSDVLIAQAVFALDDPLRNELAAIDQAFSAVKEISVFRYLDNERKYSLGVATKVPWADVEKDLTRLRAHLEKRGVPGELIVECDAILAAPPAEVDGPTGARLTAWATNAQAHVAGNYEAMIDRIIAAADRPARWVRARDLVVSRLPVLVYYSSFFVVRPRIHLTQLADRIKSGSLDEEYDFGNVCLLKLLGFDVDKLATQGHAATALDSADESAGSRGAGAVEMPLGEMQDLLDERQYELNAAAVELTAAVRRVWGSDDFRLNFNADGYYLKVVVEDEEGVEIELDQRSHGLVWLTSFYVVFKAQAMDTLANAILLLDEPGLALHALKQQEFRKTVSLLAKDNQTLYTTHSPFMVGSNELDLVRVVELKDRTTGTKVHGGILSTDPDSLFPLQAALGYNLAQSLFSQRRNLICEGLPDLWYLEGVSQLMKSAGLAGLDDDIAIVPAGGASKVVYFATLLRSQDLHVAALLDSDQAGDSAAMQDDFVRLMPTRSLHRTKDYYSGAVPHPETEDLLGDTLIAVAKSELGWDIVTTASTQSGRRICDIFSAEVSDFSKYRLAKAFVRWSSTHAFAGLTADEQTTWQEMMRAMNRSLPT
jgi:energy-coupling factor transporter ATP-binding protein EcfA2